MKRIILSLLFCTIFGNLIAQNVVPKQGAVGLGTFTPESHLNLQLHQKDNYGGEEFLKATTEGFPDKMELINISGGDDFIPALVGNKDNKNATPNPHLSREALVLLGNIDDSHDFEGNNAPIMSFVAAKNWIHNIQLQERVSYRPLFNWKNGYDSPKMTMLANGYLGIGTMRPTEQLHTTQGVRFEGLREGKVQYMLGVDENGTVWRVPLDKLVNTSKSENEAAEQPKTSLDQIRATLVREHATITYNLPTKFTDAQIFIYDLQGKQLKRFDLAPKSVQITLPAQSLKAGAYLYTLLVDGQEIATKKLILTE